MRWLSVATLTNGFDTLTLVGFELTALSVRVRKLQYFIKTPLHRKEEKVDKKSSEFPLPRMSVLFSCPLDFVKVTLQHLLQKHK